MREIIQSLTVHNAKRGAPGIIETVPPDSPAPKGEEEKKKY